jgi:hypothetical protein
MALRWKRSAKGKLFEETRAMNRTQENASSFGPVRPLVPDAPDWFNRARDFANRRPNFRSLPEPPPPPRRSRPRADSSIRFHDRPLVLVMSLVALPLVVGIVLGLRDRARDDRDTAGRSADAARQDVVTDDTGREHGTKPVELAVAQTTDGAVRRDTELFDQNRNSTTPQSDQPGFDARDSKPSKTVQVTLPGDRGEPNRALGPSRVTGDDLAGGFSLKRPGQIRHISAEVLRPASPWFDISANDGACTTGTCPAPIRNLDRKLNTALTWSPTPEAAGSEAERDGKLVFLIHVSGNFAQPGFT